MAKGTTKNAQSGTREPATSADAAPAAEAGKTATEASEAKPDEAKTVKLVPVIAVATLTGTFRRCGTSFSKEPSYFAPDFFDEDQAKALKAEPRLRVDEAEVDPDKVQIRTRPKSDEDESDQE
jgi:hypothetical protein